MIQKTVSKAAAEEQAAGVPSRGARCDE